MQQLTQNLKNGEMRILEVPFPALDPRAVLVRNHASVISAGTEGKTVRDARLGYVGKARARQKEVRQVLDSVRANGVSNTYRMVMNKLEAPAGLGYSSAGVVLAVGDEVTEFVAGDRVACAGATACHADVVAVPRNLCVRVADGVDLSHAAFATIGAIALQGVRQAELEVGSNCVVIGLGLVGMLTVQVLEAAGVRAIGIDVDGRAVDRLSGTAIGLQRDRPDLEAVVAGATRGRGADAVIITAGTSSLDPVELAGRLCRRKARVVIVGGVPTGFSREHYYRKELDLRMSCSYGPGRYDPDYEEKGIDYPIGYVRWTENRNMEAFVDLLAAKKLDVASLITHAFPLTQAPAAYQMILERSEPFMGIVLQYDVETPLATRIERTSASAPAAPAGTDPRVGLIGAGSFAQNVLLPVLKGAALIGVATARPNNARNVADRYGFEYCTGNAAEILGDGRVNTVFVLTRHNLHAPYVLDAIRAGKSVFVEKPLCLTRDELEAITTEARDRQARLFVGFNRRFAPLVRRLKELFPGGTPKAIHYRINAGVVPPEHWAHDPDVGGGRIIGEVCHFVDLARFIVGHSIVSVSAAGMATAHALQDTVAATLSFADGSIASISYFSNGNKTVGKEYLELFSGGRIATLDDFRELNVHGDTPVRERSRVADKGHGGEIAAFLDSVRTGAPSPIPLDEIHESMSATFAIVDSLRSRQAIRLA